MRAPLVIVVAHPDDEVIGAGAQLPAWANPRFIHTTDGAPRDMRDAQAHGFHKREDYARARQRELEAALSLAGLTSPELRNLACVDQEASFDLAGLVKRLVEVLTEWQPAQLITHPYEGGHPDHDATAFAVHAAVRLLHSTSGVAPEILELTSYHNRAGIMATGEFLPCASRPVRSFRLTPAQREFKQRLLNCFTTQNAVLPSFGLEWERFRSAPAYDFTQPPQEGRLYYEMFPWGMTGPRWRALATTALQTLGLEPQPVGQAFEPAGENASPARQL